MVLAIFLYKIEDFGRKSVYASFQDIYRIMICPAAVLE